jgi:hypothetical protein
MEARGLIEFGSNASRMNREEIGQWPNEGGSAYRSPEKRLD